MEDYFLFLISNFYWLANYFQNNSFLPKKHLGCKHYFEGHNKTFVVVIDNLGTYLIGKQSKVDEIEIEIEIEISFTSKRELGVRKSP